MTLISKVTSIFKRKDAQPTPATGGFELLQRLTAGAWSNTKMLETYEKSLYVFRAVDKIAEKVAGADLELFQILNSTGDTKEILVHPLLDLMWKPNPFQTREEFMKITTINLKLCGDAFWFKVKNDRGQVVELWNLRPDFMEILKDPIEFIKGYKFTRTDGVIVPFTPEEIVHFRAPTPLDDYMGVSPIRSAQTRIDTEDFASQYQRDFFLNNARPDGILKTDTVLDQEAKDDIRDNFHKAHKGIGKNSKLAIFDSGLQYEQISVNQKEMDYIESMKFTRDDILVAFGVPKSVLGISEDVNRANAETGMYVFLSEVIMPTMRDLLGKINEMLVSPDFGDNLYFDCEDLVPENRTQVLLDYDSGLTKGWLTINEVRTKENLPPLEGCDVPFLPMGLMPIGENIPQPGEPTPAAKYVADLQAKEAKRKAKLMRGKSILREKFMLVEHLKSKIESEMKKKEIKKTPPKKKKNKKKDKVPTAFIRDEETKVKYADMVNKAIDHRAGQFKKALGQLATRQKNALIVKLKNSGDLSKNKAIGTEAKKTVKKFFEEQEQVWAEFSFPFMSEYARQAGTEAMAMVNPDKAFSMSERVQAVLKRRSTEFGLGVNGTTRDKVSTAISDGLDAGEGIDKLSARITEVYAEFPRSRAELIARTESTAANNEGFMEAYKQSGVATHKEWVNAGDDRVRDEHQNGIGVGGEIVPLSRTFSNGLMFPQEPNCRCVLAPAFEQ